MRWPLIISLPYCSVAAFSAAALWAVGRCERKRERQFETLWVFHATVHLQAANVSECCAQLHAR